MHDYKILFEKALAGHYVAAMFDIDGTLMETGAYEFSREVVEALAALSMKIPLAICSGRRVEGLIEMMTPIFEAAPDPLLARKNWVLFLENGAMGLRFNASTNEYEKFYQIDWPHNELPMPEVLKKIQTKLPKILPNVIFRTNECNIGIYVPDRKNYPLKELAHITARLATATRQMLKNFKHGDRVRVADSGVAAHILPVDGDKDRGIREFAHMLRTERDLAVSPEAREILIIGDQPCAGCNDEKFLEGKWGTPFTAEHLNPERPYPIPIFSEKGEVLSGPEATLSLLRRVNWLLPDETHGS